MSTHDEKITRETGEGKDKGKMFWDNKNKLQQGRDEENGTITLQKWRKTKQQGSWRKINVILEQSISEGEKNRRFIEQRKERI